LWNPRLREAATTIETIRNYKNSMHNLSLELEWFARQLFENMLYDNENE